MRELLPPSICVKSTFHSTGAVESPNLLLASFPINSSDCG